MAEPVKESVRIEVGTPETTSQPPSVQEKEKVTPKRKITQNRPCLIIIASAFVAVCIIIIVSVVVTKLHHRHSGTVPVAADGNQTPAHHWTPDRPDPYVCEYLGENSCWQPKLSDGGGGAPYMHDGNWPARTKTCVIPAGNSSRIDDAPAVLKAFEECKTDGHIVFQNTTYHIGAVMNTTGLRNVDIEVKGTLLWSADTEYWLKNSLPIGFQNQTSAWLVGGEGIHFYGHGAGTLHGNGDVWYELGDGVSNLHGRPHQITIMDTTNSVIEGLRFLKSQMWTMTVARSERVLLQDIYVNNTSDGGKKIHVNTDGCDTVYVDNISFLRWTIDNGDDSIALKQNSTNVYIGNSTFHQGPGFAIGSIGQYPGQIEVIENVTVENIICQDTYRCARIKTWTGTVVGYPPNGGGGGIGHVKNITFKNFDIRNSNYAFGIMQCTNYLHTRAIQNMCDTSLFQVEDIHFNNITGTVKTPDVAGFHCSTKAPCPNIEVSGLDLKISGSERPADGFLCANVKDPTGFTCSKPCEGRCT